MVFSIFHSVVRYARKETGKGKYSKEEDGRNADINEDGGEYWSTLKDEEYNGREKLPPRKINISIGKVQESRPFIYLRALFHFFLFSFSFFLDKSYKDRSLRERVYLTVQIGRRGDAKTRRNTETGTSTSTGWEMMIHKPDVTEKIRFDTCRTVWK